MNPHRLVLACSLPVALTACSSASSVETGFSGPPASLCEAAGVDGLSIAETDIYGGPPYALGYPPYCIEDCRLAYVAGAGAGSNQGALMLRDLAHGTEAVLAPASEEPRRPVIAGSVIAWEATEGGKRVVRVMSFGVTETVPGPFDHAGEPRAMNGEVVMTGWSTADEAGDTDVYLYVPGYAEAKVIASGPGQQRFPDISLTHIAFADFFEDPDGRFDQNDTDLANIVIHDRTAGTVSPRVRQGKQAFPMLGAPGKIGYLAWDPVHPEPKLGAYDLFVGDLDAPVDNDALAARIETHSPYIRPVAHGSLVEWVAWPAAAGASFWRRPVDLSAPATQLSGLSGLELFAPSASENFTVLAARDPGGIMTLKALPR